MKKATLILLTLVIWGCEKPVTDIEIPPAEQKLVVTCFITPGDTNYEAQVTYSMPIYNSNYSDVTYIKDADVYVKSNGTTLKLLFDSDKMLYKAPTASLPVLSGQTYELEVLAKDGKRVTASCVVPVGPVSIKEITMNERQEDEYSKILRIQASWNDKPGIKNYYRLYVESPIAGGIPADSMYYEIGTQVMSDENVDGSVLSSWCETYLSHEPGSFDYDIYLLETDEHYYKYHEGRLRYEGDNPFAEPNIIYSNINGGLGCFGAYIKVSERRRRQ